MRTILHRWFWAWDFEKEEAWLNEKAAQGLVLAAVGFCRYEFEEGTPGEYQIRLELLERWPAHPESQRYLRFLEEAGIRQVGSIQRWVYLCRSTADGPFDLHSDLDSRLGLLRRLMTLVAVLALPNLSNCLMNLTNYRRAGLPVHLAVAGLCLAVVLLLGIGWAKLYIRFRQLKRERDIFE